MADAPSAVEATPAQSSSNPDAGKSTNMRAAAPNSNATTGRSHMAEYGALQAAQGTIVNIENEPSYPITVHALNASHMFEMFRLILVQIVWTFTRELGCPDPTTAAASTALNNIINSVAYAALMTAYAVCYNKARAQDPFTTATMPLPTFTTETFPIFITALINSLGPVQRGDYPSRRKHIPLLYMTDIINTRPLNIGAVYVNLFKEKIQRTRVLFANVELLGSTSAPWWTLFPRNDAITAATDPSARPGTTRFYRIKTVFSPVRFEELEAFFKMAAVYLPGPLIKPGLGAYSTSAWYSTDDLPKFTGPYPVRMDFPVETRTFPVFWDRCSAFYYEIEGKSVDVVHDTDDDHIVTEEEATAANVAAAKDKTRSKSSRARPTIQAGTIIRNSRKRIRADSIGNPIPVEESYRPRSPNAGPSSQDDSDNKINLYRIVYYYFDHIAISEAHPNDYVQWAYNLCAAT